MDTKVQAVFQQLTQLRLQYCCSAAKAQLQSKLPKLKIKQTNKIYFRLFSGKNHGVHNSAVLYSVDSALLTAAAALQQLQRRYPKEVVWRVSLLLLAAPPHCTTALQQPWPVASATAISAVHSSALGLTVTSMLTTEASMHQCNSTVERLSTALAKPPPPRTQRRQPATAPKRTSVPSACKVYFTITLRLLSTYSLVVSASQLAYLTSITLF